MRQGLARGTRMRIISGSHRGKTGTVVETVFQKTVDYPDELHHGYQVILDDGAWVTVRQDDPNVRSRTSQPLVAGRAGTKTSINSSDRRFGLCVGS